MNPNNRFLETCYALISEFQRGAVLGQYGDLTVDGFRVECIKQARGGFQDYNPSPYLMISEQNDKVTEWIKTATDRYALWLRNGKPSLAE